MKKNLSLYLSLFLALTLAFTACKKDDDPAPITPPTAGLTLLSEGYATGAGVKVEVWAKAAYFTGYNTLYLYLKDSVSGAAINSATVSLNPMMDMGTMMHSAPSENPVNSSSSTGLYQSAVVFLMSSMGGAWTLNVDVDNLSNGLSGTAAIPVTVADLAVSRVKSFISQVSAETLVVSFLQPEKPVVGLNDLEVVIHKRTNMGMDFPADSSLSVEISPLMVFMGHGSPNNVNPVHMGMGHYKGKVNYTMSGDWQINFTFLSGTSVANNSLFFETLVP